MWGNSWCPKPTTARWHRCAMLPASWAEACMKIQSHFCFILTTERHCEAKLYVQCVFCHHPSRVHQHSPAGLVIVQVEWKQMKKKTNVVHLLLTKVCSSNNHFCLLQKFLVEPWNNGNSSTCHTHQHYQTQHVCADTLNSKGFLLLSMLALFPSWGWKWRFGDMCEFTLKLLQILTPN